MSTSATAIAEQIASMQGGGTPAPKPEDTDAKLQAAMDAVWADTKPKPVVEASAAPVADKPTEVKAEESKAPAATDDAEAREAEVLAKRGLLRTGWEQADIDKLDHDTLVRSGKAAWKTIEKMDKRFDELRAGRKPGDADSAPADGAASPRADDQDKAKGADPTLIPADLLELLDDEQQKALQAHVSKIRDEAAKPHAAKARQAAEELETLRANAFTDRCERARQKVAAEFPQVAGKEPPQRYLDRINRLVKSYDVDSDAELESLFLDAAWTEYGKDKQQADRTAAIAANRQARSGAPLDIGSGTSAAPKPSTDDTLNDAFAAVMASSNSAEFLQRLTTAKQR